MHLSSCVTTYLKYLSRFVYVKWLNPIDLFYYKRAGRAFRTLPANFPFSDAIYISHRRLIHAFLSYPNDRALASVAF